MEHRCDINFAGSSPAMECEGAVVLWERSPEHHNRDGDSKAFNSIKNVYGAIKVEKLDCVEHVQEKKHLLNLEARTKEKLAVGRPIGGIGRLSDAKIKKYYGLVIRQNTIRKSNPARREVEVAVYAMKKKNIMENCNDAKSDNLAKQHRFCPPDEPSWCKWKQDETTGTSTYSCVNCWPQIFLEVLKPTFTT